MGLAGHIVSFRLLNEHPNTQPDSSYRSHRILDSLNNWELGHTPLEMYIVHIREVAIAYDNPDCVLLRLN